MRFKTDENLPVEVADLLVANGHDAISVVEQGLGGAADSTIADVCGSEERCLAHRKAFPDWTEDVEGVIIDHEWIAVRFTSRGTNTGEFLGNPPTGNRVEISEVVVFRLEDGQIAEQWVYPDMLSLQRQLSVRHR